jgi:hypothetical protein
MGQFLGENIPYLNLDSTTQVSLPATYLGQPTRLQVMGQGYKLNSALILSTASTGLGGLDTGSLAANTLYYVYAAVSANVVGLVASVNAPSTGPTGFTQWRQIGSFRTQSGSAAINYVMNSVVQDEDQWTPIAGSLSGSAVPAGYVGEMVGAPRSGNNGFSYSTRSITALTTTPSTILSVSLNKGVYIASYKLHCSGSVALNMNAILQVGGTPVEAQSTRGYASTTVFGTCTNSLPIVVSADGTTVSVYGGIDVGTSASNSHELWVVRIA